MFRSAGPVLLALSALLAGCAPAPNATTAPTGPPIVEASPTAASPGVSTLPASPSPSPLASPVGLPAFTTPVPPGAGTAWSWTSSDGRSWRAMRISATGPTNKGGWPLQMLTLTPIGVLWIGNDGSTWFGQPAT